MKKHVLTLITLAAVIAAACTRTEAVIPDEGQTPASQEDDLINLTFNAVSQDVDTKSDISDSFILWEDGDYIAIYDGSDLNAFEADVLSDGGKSATFTGSAAETSNYVAVAPASASSMSGGQVFVSIPSEQAIVSGHCVDDGALLSTAVTDESLDLAFTNCFSLVKVNLNRTDVSSILIKSNGGENISGEKQLNTADGSVSGDPTESYVRATHKTSEGERDNFPAGDYYIPIWPATMASGLKIIMTLDDGSKAAKSLSASQTFPRNSGIDMSCIDNVTTWCPLTITTAKQLKMWRRVAEDYSSGQTISLGADIDLSEGSGTAYSWTSPERFIGVFNGQNHKIYNFEVNVSSGDKAGFIANLGPGEDKDAILKNIVFGSSNGTSADGKSSIKISSGGSDWHFAGLIGKADAYSKIENVTNFIPVTVLPDVTAKHFAGGIVGNISSLAQVSGCINKASVISQSGYAGASSQNTEAAIGGIAGGSDGNEPVISSCTNSGAVTNECVGVASMGGIIGRAIGDGLFIDSCSNSGKISNNAASTAWSGYSGLSDLVNLGGIIGTMMGNDIVINKCSNSGQVVQASKVAKDLDLGGIAGAALKDGGIIRGCFNEGQMRVTAADFDTDVTSGGILGFANNGSMTNTITLTKADDGTWNINDAKFEQEVNHKANLYIGGIVGGMSTANGLIEYCRNQGRFLSGTKSSQGTTGKIFRCGGIVSHVRGSAVRHCINTETAYFHMAFANLKYYVGGIVGSNAGAHPSEVSDCLNEGALCCQAGHGDSEFGGIMSYLDAHETTVSACTNKGLITSGTVFSKSTWEPVTVHNVKSVDVERGGLFGRLANVGSESGVEHVASDCIVACDFVLNDILDVNLGDYSWCGIVAGYVPTMSHSSPGLYMGSNGSGPIRILSSTCIKTATDADPSVFTTVQTITDNDVAQEWIIGHACTYNYAKATDEEIASGAAARGSKNIYRFRVYFDVSALASAGTESQN